MVKRGPKGGMLQFISKEKIRDIHIATLEVLEKVGMYSPSEKILKIFSEAGAEVDSKENIVSYMEKTLRKCNTFVLFCSENSLKSESVKGEWQSAYQMRKRGLMKIIPVYEDEDFIPILLMPMLNVKFKKDNFNEFIDKLYNEILR